MSLVLENLMYSPTHEWVQDLGDGRVKIGLTDYAQQELSSVVFVNLPEVGDTFSVNDSFADVESVKAVSEVYCPVEGEVLEINEELIDSPEKINEDPYEAWLVIVGNITSKEELMDSYEYNKFLEAEETLS